MRKYCSLLLALAACGDNKGATPVDGPLPDSPVADVAVADAPDVDPACLAPLALPSDPDAKTHAQAALTALAPAADMTWADARNTLASINGLVVKLPTCTGDANAFDQLFATLSANPDLFQIDANEWTSGTASCSDILANGFTPLTIRRAKYGPYDIQHDVFTAVADVQAGEVILRNFSGTYLPKPSAAILSSLAACPDLSTDVVAKLLFNHPFVYEAYAPTPAPACTAAGNYMYSKQAGDTVSYASSITFDWTEDPSVVFQRQGLATLVVGTANYTGQLLNSSANCAGDDGTPNIGWQRTYNSVTAEILSDRATPDPFCTVCLK